MEKILYALRHHCIGLNCGIWDYSASIISLFGKRPEFVISDRTRYVNTDQLFLNTYIRLLIQTCHKHAALATGGMAALVLPDQAEDPRSANRSKQYDQPYTSTLYLLFDCSLGHSKPMAISNAVACLCILFPFN